MSLTALGPAIEQKVPPHTLKVQRAKLIHRSCCVAKTPQRGWPTRISINHGLGTDSGHGLGLSRPGPGAPSRPTALVVVLSSPRRGGPTRISVIEPRSRGQWTREGYSPWRGGPTRISINHGPERTRAGHFRPEYGRAMLSGVRWLTALVVVLIPRGAAALRADSDHGRGADSGHRVDNSRPESGRAKLTDRACCGAKSRGADGLPRISINHGPEQDSGHGLGISRPESGRARAADRPCRGANSPLRGGQTRISVNHGLDSGPGQRILAGYFPTGVRARQADRRRACCGARFYAARRADSDQ